jgi:UDP-N-acetyl-2-amino-2-deoxyglucuronate dehydrogenase
VEKIRFGVVGCGVIAPHHAKAAIAAPDAELVACCDIIPERAEKFAAEFGIPKVYTDYSQLMADPDIDAVNVCTPSGLHGDVTIAAAKAGKHVLCEKPVDITLEKIDEMVKACRDAKVKLAVIFQRRTSPLWGKIKKVIDDGKLGKLVLCDLYIKYFRSQEYYDSGEWRGTWALDGGGCLMNQGVHMIDILRYLAGPADTMYALADHLVRKIETEDTACAVIKWKSGAFGVLQGTTSVTPGLKHRLEIHGEHGGVVVEGESILRWSVPDVPNPEEAKDEVGDTSGDAKAITSDGHTIQLIDLCEAIRNDRDPMVTGEEARKAVELILGVYKSAQSGQVVKFPL